MGALLVVDDDPDAAETLAELLQYEGHEVRVAYDGREGLELIHTRLPDLILLDVDMPLLDGPGMAYAMLLHDAGQENVPILLVSGIPNLDEVAQRVGTPYRLGKPITCEHLLATVERALLERTPPRR